MSQGDGYARKEKGSVQYYTYSDNIRGALENGSFCRVYSGRTVVQYTNGDYMGVIPKVPESVVEVSADIAADYLPPCCK